MGLTSGAFVALVTALAAGGVAAVVWAWPKASGQRLPDVWLRLALVAASQLLMLATVGVWLNAYFSFYGSLAQVTGSGRPGPATRTIQIPRTSAGDLRLVTIQRSRPVSPGRLLQVTISGQRTGLSSGTGYVYLPPQYYQRAYAGVRFPVVLALSGYPGGATGLVSRLGLPAVAAGLTASGRIRPTVFVLLSVSPLLPYDTECTDIPGGPQVESFFAQDVTRAVEQAFRVTSDPAGWGVIGYSTGGFCAVKLAMMYPTRFTAAVSMAGYYRADSGRYPRDLWGGSLAYRLANSPAWRLSHLPAPPVSLLVTSSRVGERSLPGTLAFLHEIHPPMRGYSLLIAEGGHNFRIWHLELVPSLEWLSRRLS